MHMYDELGIAVYEMIGSVVEGAGEAPVQDNGNSRPPCHQRHITYGMHELMEKPQC